jgi:DNA mismatch repair protein MutS
MGAFVPAKRAIIGTCDRIFTRVGASDDLARGQSTFMVEMAETASILHQATARSLVLLDEIGRGTSTYDGLAIAWAVAEDLNERIRCRTLFATHYHELCQLAETHKGVVNLSVAVSEHGDSIVFLRRLKEGGTSRSYGIQCARIAGLPEDVITRAKSLLTALESRGLRDEQGQLSLFGDSAQDETPQPVPEPVKGANSALLEKVLAARPDEMTPREALDLLYEITSLQDLK